MDRAEVNHRLFPMMTMPPPKKPCPPRATSGWRTVPLMLDALRLQHLVRQRAYYAAHWQRLRAPCARQI